MKHVKRKNTGLHLYTLKAQSKNQEEALAQFEEGQNLLMMGPAGSGKTIVAMYLGLREVAMKRADRLVVVRSVVPSRDMGFLPGNVDEKVAQFEVPYRDACSILYDRADAYECLRAAYQLDFTTTSYARGINIRNSILFVDEASNMTYHECDTMITRVAEGTRVIVCGDSKQSDLRPDDREGFVKFCDVIEQMKSFTTIEFSVDDVRRSELVREYLTARKRVLRW